MNKPSRRKPFSRPHLESLEARQLLAVFGTPWPEARSLTISFPADGTEIGSQPSELREMLDAVTDRENWQELVLRAFQTWAFHADINIGLRADHDLPFGAPGLLVGDPRFGDFRLGAIPQRGVLANALPFQVEAGTFSGDIFLNSSLNFSFHDWSDALPPEPELGPPEPELGPTQPQPTQPEPTQPGPTDSGPTDSGRSETFDLFSVVLHEAGNALGLEDNMDRSSVMFAHYTVPKGVLMQQDIDEILKLYGARSDPYEQVDNGQLRTATLIPTPVRFRPDSETIEVNGSLRTSDDVDVYKFAPLRGQQGMQVVLQASGISLLQSKVEIVDASGKRLAAEVASSVFENDIVIDLKGLENHSTLYVRVSAKDDSVYSVGDYRLRLDYRSPLARVADPFAGHYARGIESLWANFDLVDREHGTNDTIDQAAEMPAAAGVDSGKRFEVFSSVYRPSPEDPTDIDVWKVTSPEQLGGPLVVHLSPVGQDAARLRVRLLDATGEPAGASGYLRDDGTWTLELAQPQASTEYYIRVSVDPNSVVDVGNYVASAEFDYDHARMHSMVSRSISSSADEFIRWRAGKTKLFRFDLTAGGVVGDEWVQVTFYDAHTHEIRMKLSTPAGGRRTAFALLDQGDYLIRFTAVSRSGLEVQSINLELLVDGLSDDQDPNDPIEDEDYYVPDYDPYYYYYQGHPDDFDPDEFIEDPEYNYTYYDDGPGDEGGGSGSGG